MLSDLFGTTQVGLAVGDIQKERDKAVLTKFDLQVITDYNIVNYMLWGLYMQ